MGFSSVKAVAAVVCALGLGLTSAVAVAQPQPDKAPTVGTATRFMHRDLNSSDAITIPGPGSNVDIASSVPGGACSTVFAYQDGMVAALCTAYLGTSYGLTPVAPTLVLFDPVTAQPLTRLELRKTGLFGGVYGYVNDRDQVVVAEGHDVVLISHHRDEHGNWFLRIDERLPIEGLQGPEPIAGLIPDGHGRIWFTTRDAQVGYLADGRTHRIVLGADTPGRELVANGLTPRPQGVSVITTHRLYEVAAADGQEPTIKWQRDYDRGPRLKPGQLSWGSGTTPTVFGDNDQYVAIVDNADPSPYLYVFDVNTGETVCSAEAFVTTGKGTENSLMADGNSLWIPSTYGFVYPPLAIAGKPQPLFAPFQGGLTRVDVIDGTCVRVFETNARIATLPILSTADRTIYSFATDPRTLATVYQGISADTGEVVFTRHLGYWPIDEPMELTGMMGDDSVLWQATMGHMFRIAPRN